MFFKKLIVGALLVIVPVIVIGVVGSIVRAAVPDGLGDLPQFQSATCSASKIFAYNGDTITFFADGGPTGAISYNWSFPAGIAACVDGRDQDSCTTGPLGADIASGDFTVSVTDELGQTADASCPAIDVVLPPQPRISASLSSPDLLGEVLRTTNVGGQESFDIFVRNTGGGESIIEQGLPPVQEPQMRVAYGEVSALGFVSRGSGDFVAAKIGEGVYRITFNDGVFSDFPAIALTPVEPYVNRGGKGYPYHTGVVRGVNISSGKYSAEVAFGASVNANGSINTKESNPSSVGFTFVAVGKTENPRNDFHVTFGVFKDDFGVITNINRGTGGWSASSLDRGHYGLSLSHAPSVVVLNSNTHIQCASVHFGASIEITASHSNEGSGCRYPGRVGSEQISFLAISPSSNPNVDDLRFMWGRFSKTGSIMSGSSGDFSVFTSNPVPGGIETRHAISPQPQVFGAAPIFIGNATDLPLFGSLAGEYGICSGFSDQPTSEFDSAGVIFAGKSKRVCKFETSEASLGTSFIAVGAPYVRPNPIIIPPSELTWGCEVVDALPAGVTVDLSGCGSPDGFSLPGGENSFDVLP